MDVKILWEDVSEQSIMESVIGYALSWGQNFTHIQPNSYIETGPSEHFNVLAFGYKGRSFVLLSNLT